ncbi:unnamed protein product [Chrysoparadoxa australica]
MKFLALAVLLLGVIDKTQGTDGDSDVPPPDIVHNFFAEDDMAGDLSGPASAVVDAGGKQGLRGAAGGQRMMLESKVVRAVCATDINSYAIIDTTGALIRNEQNIPYVFETREALHRYIIATRQHYIYQRFAVTSPDGTNKCTVNPSDDPTVEAPDPMTSGLLIEDLWTVETGKAYSIWVFVLNKPQNCKKPFDCTLEDVMFHCKGGLAMQGDAVAECGLSGFNGGGLHRTAAEDTAQISYDLNIRKNSCPDEALALVGKEDEPYGCMIAFCDKAGADAVCPLLESIETAAIITVLRSHGAASSDPAILLRQKTEMMYGCETDPGEPEICMDVDHHVISGYLLPARSSLTSKCHRGSN